ncbi:hypothetical protein RY27_02370 [Litorilinea aerophila]|nr:hypothetical protein RY27_02370 [Litorilinea aerophila]
MHIHLQDRYHHRESLIHGLDPRTKVALTILFILAVSLAPFGAFGIYVLLWLAAMAAAYFSRLGPLFVLKRSVIALPFALAAITLPFTVPGETIATLPLFGGLAITDAGTLRALSILVKSWISVQMAILLVATTPFHDLLWALRALYVPAPLVAIISFMYRYLNVLADEALRLLRARAARSAALPGVPSGGSLTWRGKVAGYMVGSLMLRSFERSERIYQAMVARGYRGSIRTLAHHHPGFADWVAWAVMFLLLAIVLMVKFL